MDERINAAAESIRVSEAEAVRSAGEGDSQRAAADAARASRDRAAAEEVRALCKRFAAWAMVNSVPQQTMVVEAWKHSRWRSNPKQVVTYHAGWAIATRSYSYEVSDGTALATVALWIDPSGEIIASPFVKGGMPPTYELYGEMEAPADAAVLPFDVEQGIVEHVARSGRNWA